MDYKLKTTRSIKAGSKWKVTATNVKTFDDYGEAKTFYNNIMSDDNFGGKTRITNNYSSLGMIDSKTFYNPSGDVKTVYSFS